MQRTMFNEPRPKGHAEIVEAIDEAGLDASMCTARVEEETENDGFGGTGWTAEICGEDYDGEPTEVHTLAYESKDNLISDLEAAGIPEIEED